MQSESISTSTIVVPSQHGEANAVSFWRAVLIPVSQMINFFLFLKKKKKKKKREREREKKGAKIVIFRVC